MRWQIVVGILLIAGCAQPVDTDTVPDDQQRRSVGGGSEQDGTRFNVSRLFSTPITMAATDEQSFDVVVPNGTTELYFVHTPELEGTLILRDFWVEVDSCGRWQVTGLWGGNVIREEDLCKQAVPGPAKFIIGTDGGYVHGDFELWGRTPRLDNATANG